MTMMAPELQAVARAMAVAAGVDPSQWQNYQTQAAQFIAALDALYAVRRSGGVRGDQWPAS